MLDAVTGNKAVHCLAYGNALLPESAEMAGSLQPHIQATERMKFKFKEQAPGGVVIGVATETLQHFGENEIAHCHYGRERSASSLLEVGVSRPLK